MEKPCFAARGSHCRMLGLPFPDLLAQACWHPQRQLHVPDICHLMAYLHERTACHPMPLIFIKKSRLKEKRRKKTCLAVAFSPLSLAQNAAMPTCQFPQFVHLLQVHCRCSLFGVGQRLGGKIQSYCTGRLVL